MTVAVIVRVYNCNTYATIFGYHFDLYYLSRSQIDDKPTPIPWQFCGHQTIVPQTSFVPNASGKLHTPSQLYDPRVPELVALLDPDTCFPGPALCTDHLEPIRDQSEAAQSSEGSEGTAGGFSGLSALQQLGLRSTADLGTLVKAAKFVERTAKEGDEDMAVARGKVSERRIGARLGQSAAGVWCLSIRF